MKFNQLYKLISESVNMDDEKYISAVKRGDMHTAQKMVIDKFKELSEWGSGYDIWRVLPQGESTFPMIIEDADGEVHLITLYAINTPNRTGIFNVDTGKELIESSYKQYSVLTGKLDKDTIKIINHIFNVDDKRNAGFQIVDYDSDGNIIPLSQRFATTHTFE